MTQVVSLSKARVCTRAHSFQTDITRLLVFKKSNFYFGFFVRRRHDHSNVEGDMQE